MESRRAEPPLAGRLRGRGDGQGPLVGTTGPGGGRGEGCCLELEVVDGEIEFLGERVRRERFFVCLFRGRRGRGAGGGERKRKRSWKSTVEIRLRRVSDKNWGAIFPLSFGHE